MKARVRTIERSIQEKLIIVDQTCQEGAPLRFKDYRSRHQPYPFFRSRESPEGRNFGGLSARRPPRHVADRSEFRAPDVLSIARESPHGHPPKNSGPTPLPRPHPGRSISPPNPRGRSRTFESSRDANDCRPHLRRARGARRAYSSCSVEDRAERLPGRCFTVMPMLPIRHGALNPGNHGASASIHQGIKRPRSPVLRGP
jgi:hypothetical protein